MKSEVEMNYEKAVRDAYKLSGLENGLWKARKFVAREHLPEFDKMLREVKKDALDKFVLLGAAFSELEHSRK